MKRMKVFAIITVMVFTMGALIGCGDVEDALASIPTDAITIAEAETNETPTDGETDLKKAEPVQTKEPASTEKPVQTEKTAATEEPVQTEEPTETEEPTATEEPVQTEKPTTTEKPVATEKPATTEKPVQTEKPAATEKPVQTEKPAATEKPVTSQSENSEQATEPSTSDYWIPDGVETTGEWYTVNWTPGQNTPAQNTEPAQSEPAQPEPVATPVPTPEPQPVHEHVWKEHTTTTQTWIPNIVVVEDYETQYVVVGGLAICNCGFQTTDKDAITEHVKEGYSEGRSECSNFGVQDIYEEQQVLVGTHEEDQGHYETSTYVDYYYCDCGATKN